MSTPNTIFSLFTTSLSICKNTKNNETTIQFQKCIRCLSYLNMAQKWHLYLSCCSLNFYMIGFCMKYLIFCLLQIKNQKNQRSKNSEIMVDTQFWFQFSPMTRNCIFHTFPHRFVRKGAHHVKQYDRYCSIWISRIALRLYSSDIWIYKGQLKVSKYKGTK